MSGDSPKRALVTGLTGQDGSYLAELLLEKGYEVHGIIRRSSSFNTSRIEHLYRDPHEPGTHLFSHYGDLSDPVALTRLIYELQPEEIYNLGAQSHVRVSFDIPEYTFDVTGGGTLRLLEAIRESEVKTRFYQASSSEIFGSTPPPQDESTPFHPRSPYAVAKVAAYWTTVNYREAYGMFAVNGILFNHESPRRGETFVTRKITRAVARIKAGLQDKLYMGNLDAERDWGYAPDFVEGMWMMLQAEEPDDYCLATGEKHSVREALEVAFAHVGLDYEEHVEIDPRYFRPAEVDSLLGDAGKAKEKLGWEPKVRFKELVALMVDADVTALDEQLSGKSRALMADRVPDPAFWSGKDVVVTGGAGFLGKPTVRLLDELGAAVRVPRSSEHDLTDAAAARAALEGADVVIHLAANVGGIGFNRRNPAPLVRDNMAMGLNVFDACRDLEVGKLVAACSVCAYPKFMEVPFREEDLWVGYPEESNAPYGLAKKMLIVLSDAYRRQYGLDSCVPVVANLYGPDDNFDLEDSHVIAAMVHKYVVATEEEQPEVVLWGTGEPSREFLYVEDAARAMILAAEHADSSEPFNVGTGVETRIRDLAELVSAATGFQGETVWDTSRPDGQPVRYLEVSKAAERIGFRAEVGLDQGLKRTVESFRDSLARA